MREAQSSKRKAKNQNSKLKTFKFLVLNFSFALFALRFTLSSFAVEIEPMRLEYSLQAGKTYSGSFKLNNSSNFAVNIFVSTGEYRYIFSEGMTPPAVGKKGLASCKDWFQFEKTKISLGSGETANVKFLIKVPRDAKEERLCAALFDEKRNPQEEASKENEGNVRIQLTPRFSIPVYISIKGAEKISAEIKSISIAAEPQKGGVKINIALENTGNVHIRPLGTLIILNQKGEVIKNLPMGKSLPLFPGYKETIPVFCPKLPAGKYSAVATIEISKDNIIQKKTSFDLAKTGDIE